MKIILIYIVLQNFIFSSSSLLAQRDCQEEFDRLLKTADHIAFVYLDENRRNENDFEWFTFYPASLVWFQKGQVKEVELLGAAAGGCYLMLYFGLEDPIPFFCWKVDVEDGTISFEKMICGDEWEVKTVKVSPSIMEDLSRSGFQKTMGIQRARKEAKGGCDSNAARS